MHMKTLFFSFHLSILKLYFLFLIHIHRSIVRPLRTCIVQWSIRKSKKLDAGRNEIIYVSHWKKFDRKHIKGWELTRSISTGKWAFCILFVAGRCTLSFPIPCGDRTAWFSDSGVSGQLTAAYIFSSTYTLKTTEKEEISKQKGTMKTYVSLRHFE